MTCGLQWPVALVFGLVGLGATIGLALPGLAVGLPIAVMVRCFSWTGACSCCEDDVNDLFSDPWSVLMLAAFWPVGLVCCPCITFLGCAMGWGDD
eukprot:COSAG02_NODE_5037_length_4704_cov_2.206253_4_plen_95_part_00